MRLVARQAEQVGEGRTGRWGIGSTKAAAAAGSAIAHSHRSCWQSMTIPASSRSKYATGTTSRGADCKPPVHAAVRAICWISPGICRHPKPSRMRARLPAPSPEGLPMEPSAEAPASPTAGPSPAPRWYGRPPGRWRAWSTMPTESLRFDSLGDFELTPELDADLGALASRAKSDPAARNALMPRSTLRSPVSSGAPATAAVSSSAITMIWHRRPSSSSVTLSGAGRAMRAFSATF